MRPFCYSMAKHLLSDRKIRTAKTMSGPYRLFDGSFLCVAGVIVAVARAVCAERSSLKNEK